MTADSLPLWVTIPGSLLLVIGGLTTLAGSIGLLRFADFFARLHGPALGNSLGLGCVLLTSMLTASAFAGRVWIHEILIAVLVFATAPITSILLVQAALYRNRVRGARGAANRSAAAE